MAWFLAFALVFEGFLIYQAFYAASALMKVTAFIMLIPITLTLVKVLLVSGLAVVFVRLGWAESATDSQLRDIREQNGRDEEGVPKKKSQWKRFMERDDEDMEDLSNPLNPLSPLNPMNDHDHNHHGSMF